MICFLKWNHTKTTETPSKWQNFSHRTSEWDLLRDRWVWRWSCISFVSHLFLSIDFVSYPRWSGIIEQLESKVKTYDDSQCEGGLWVTKHKIARNLDHSFSLDKEVSYSQTLNEKGASGVKVKTALTRTRMSSKILWRLLSSSSVKDTCQDSSLSVMMILREFEVSMRRTRMF
jgi:hypothetical protein